MAENVVPPAAALDGTAPLRGLDQAGQLKGREAEGALHLARRAALLLLLGLLQRGAFGHRATIESISHQAPRYVDTKIHAMSICHREPR